MRGSRTPKFNKNSAIYNITYVSGEGSNARTFRWQLGQMLPSIDSCIYDIVEEIDPITKKKIWNIFSYNYITREILLYRTTSSFDEITTNQSNLLSYED